MKNWFRWHVIILIKKPHFFLFWKNKIDFFLQTRSWIVKHILFDTMLWYDCYYLYHLPIQLFKAVWSDQEFFVSLSSLVFFFKTWRIFWPLKNITFISFTLFCRTRVLGLRCDDTKQFQVWMNEHVRWKKQNK